MTVKLSLKFAFSLTAVVALISAIGVGPASAADASKSLYVNGVLKTTAYYDDSANRICVRSLNGQVGSRSTVQIYDDFPLHSIQGVSDPGGDNDQTCATTWNSWDQSSLDVRLQVCFVSAAGKSTCDSTGPFHP